jgi:hypothetical protein
MTTAALATESPWRQIVTAATRPPLRRLCLVVAGFTIAEMGSWIAVTTVAHGFGGVREASFVLVAQLAPAAVAAAGVGSLAHRFGAHRVLRFGLVAQTVGFAAVAFALAMPAPSRVAVYAGAILAATAVVTTRPMVAALLPGAVDDPRQLAAANAVFGWLEGAAMFLGPSISAIAFALGDEWTPFVVFAALTFVTFAISAGIGHDAEFDDDEPIALRDASRAVTRDPGVRSVLVAIAGIALALGALDLLYVVLAVDVLHGHEADAGWLNTAFGAGSLVGAAVALAFAHRRRIFPLMFVSAMVMAAALAALGLGRTRGGTAMLLVVCGVAEALCSINARTLLQRAASLKLLCHVFALAEALHMAMLLAGAVVVPLFVEVFSARWAGIGVAVLVAAAVASGARAMNVADRAAEAWIDRLPALRATPLLAVLPPPALETLARQAVPCAYPAGTTIFSQGDPGDSYHALTRGAVSVYHHGKYLRTIRPGGGFGELALLHDVPRTATIVADEDSETLAIERVAFLVAVTRHAPAMSVAAEDAERYIW